jgi:hypothetical protein
MQLAVAANKRKARSLPRAQSYELELSKLPFEESGLVDSSGYPRHGTLVFPAEDSEAARTNCRKRNDGLAGDKPRHRNT